MNLIHQNSIEEKPECIPQYKLRISSLPYEEFLLQSVQGKACTSNNKTKMQKKFQKFIKIWYSIYRDIKKEELWKKIRKKVLQ